MGFLLSIFLGGFHKIQKLLILHTPLKSASLPRMTQPVQLLLNSALLVCDIVKPSFLTWVFNPTVEADIISFTINEPDCNISWQGYRTGF
jgi:hypothetical protein